MFLVSQRRPPPSCSVFPYTTLFRSQWLEVGENGFLTNSYLAQLATAAKARLFVSYATGGADWYPDHLSFMFSRRNPARTALLTANWEQPEALKDKLAPVGCGDHYTRALDIFPA